MGNVIFSKISKDYGYESGGEQVKIVLKVTRSSTPVTITSFIVEGDDNTVPQIWDALKAAWNAYAWALPKPALTIDHTSGVHTEFTSASVITFNSIEVFVNVNNPLSLELPKILGLSRTMLSDTGSVKIDWDTTYNEFPGVIPYIGTWRLPLSIDTGYGFKSTISKWNSISTKVDTATDVTHSYVDNGPFEVVRGISVDIVNVPYVYLREFDEFIKFSKNGEVDLEFNFDIFKNNTYDAYIWVEESGDATVLFEQEQLMSYTLALIPSSNLEA